MAFLAMRALTAAALIAAAAGAASSQERSPAPLPPERERALQPKDRFKECEVCPDMVVVPVGSFTMGSPEAEQRHFEKPQHKVTIGKAFAIGKFEVTVDQFATFVKESAYDAGPHWCFTIERLNLQRRSDRSWRNPGYVQTGMHPVACVNFDDARAYVAWLSRKTGKAYRLPTEAEWEYAARAGTTTRYSFGDDERGLCTHGNGGDCSDGHVYTAPVGSFAANGFGLHDMHGNVSEWTDDCHEPDYRRTPVDGSATKTGDCKVRVTRGGSWFDAPISLRSASRSHGETSGRVFTLGFRVARTIAP